MGGSHGQSSYSPWDDKELDMTEGLSTHAHMEQNGAQDKSFGKCESP